MLNNADITGLRILVTRAVHQQESFYSELKLLSAKPYSFPLITITDVENPEVAKLALKHHFDSDIIIFVSPNAVNFSHKILNFPWSNCSALIGAVGDITRKNLLEYGQNVKIMPIEDYSSQGLLRIPCLQQVKGRRIAIVGGNISRPLLKDTLRDRGAKVEHIEVYKNTLPSYSSEEVHNAFVNFIPHVICITSNQGIINLLKIADVNRYPTLLTTPLVVNSSRCAKLADTVGFKSDIVVTDSPGDYGQLRALRRWNFNQSNRKLLKDNEK